MPDTCADLESVRRVAQAAGWRRIGIDGVGSVGQSLLAEKLSRSLACPALDLDNYLFKNQGGFVDFIDYPALSAALSSIPAYILSGVCLRDVLANCGAKLDGHIYLKRMSHGLWADEDECVFPEGVEAAIDNLARNSAQISNHFDERSDQPGNEVEVSSPQLTEEIIRYHDRCRPHEVADLIYEQSGGE